MASPAASPSTATCGDHTLPSFMRPTAASQARSQRSASPKAPEKLSHSSKTSHGSFSSAKGLSPSTAINLNSVMTGRVAFKAVDAKAKTVLEQHVETDADDMANPTPSPVQVADNVPATKSGRDDALDQSATTPTTEEREPVVGPAKRKRAEDDETAKNTVPESYDATSELVTADDEPAEKKRKAVQKKKGIATRKTARRVIEEEDSEEEIVVVSQPKRKVAPKKPALPKKPILDDQDRREMREAERIRLNASKGKLAKGKFLKSFRDIMDTPPRFAHNYPAPKRTTVAPTMSQDVNARGAPAQKPAVRKPTVAKPAIEEEEAEKTAVVDENDPSVLIVDVTKVKYLRTGVKCAITASLENIMNAPELYPNIEITYNDVGKPVQARVANYDHNEWEEMLKVSKAKARKQRAEATKQARKLALQNGDIVKTGRVTKPKGARRLAPNLTKS